MNSKKLVRDIIKRNNNYGRIPYSFSTPPGFEDNPDKKLVQEVKALIQQMPKDSIWYFCYCPPSDWNPKENLQKGGFWGNHYSDGVDEWGVKWEKIYTTYHPLEEWEALKNYHFPDPYAPGRLYEAKELIEENKEKYLLWFFGFTLFEKLWSLRGFENLLMDPYIYPQRFIYLRDRIMDFDRGITQQFLTLGFDGVMVGDDLGGQENLLMNPSMWRKYYKPCYREIFDIIHAKGLDVWMHTDGNVTEIIPDLIQIGLDVLNPVQPSAMDIQYLSREFGNDLSFFGGIDVQTFLPKGTPQIVDQEIKHLIETLGRPDGGYIPSPTNALLSDLPLANIKAALIALKKYSVNRK